MRWLITLSLFTAANIAVAEDAQKLLKEIKAVTREGAGNPEAQAAWKLLVSQGGESLFPTLAAMDDATPLTSNWLRSAVNAIAEKEKASGKMIPAKQLEEFVLDTKHGPVGRRLAYELLTEADPKAPDRLLPGFINDPSGDLRRDAIAAVLPKAEADAKKDPKAALPVYEKLFEASRDQDQAEKIAKTLKELGGKPDLTTHFGVVNKWFIVGPFDSAKGTGFDKVYEPEKGVDLKAAYKGKDSAEVKWQPLASEDTYGLVNFNKSIAKHMDAAAYAYTVVESDADRPVELRFGSYCAVKIFLNGKPIYAREEYHHGERFDQYLALGTLKKGKNELLVKVCQNNQKDSWAQNWQFMFRICDATGGAVPVKVVSGEK
ncbi:hypothetical protein [Zavarzinella formosa]|uniref:hypothetical protein n=1 Tax=Zavarzinella formosa TaxID=360055 RepID=UPI0002F014D9|nr:hypothetical protein [Zavarzinella formosa]